MPKPVIDYSKCTLKKICADICPVDVFEIQDEKMVVAKPDECIGCRACEAQCHESAIVIED